MDDILQRQIQIPPPVQSDGLSQMATVHIAELNHHVIDESFTAPQRARRIVRRAHRTFSPVAILVGYLTSAAVGVSLGLSILRWFGVMALVLIIAMPASAGNRELYVALRQQAKAEGRAAREAEMIERVMAQTQAAMMRHTMKQLESNELRKAKLMIPIPNHTDLDERQLRDMQLRFRNAAGVN